MSATSESGAAASGGLEQQLLALRDMVFRKSAQAADSAKKLRHDVELLAARVELMTALADSDNGVDGALAHVEQATTRLEALKPADSETILDLIAALLVAGRESEALIRVLGLMDADQQAIDYAQTVMLIEYLFVDGRAVQAERLLQRTLHHLGAGIAGLLSTTVATVLSGRREIIAPANRRLLVELLGLVDRHLLSEPDDPALLRIRARSLIDLGRYQDALGAVDAVLARDESDASARWLRVISLTRLDDYQAALQDFDLLPLERASTPWALAIRIHLLQSLGLHPRALEAAAEAVEQYPDHLDVQLAHALAVDAAGHPEQALELIAELLGSHPDNADLLTVQAVLLRRRGRLAEATEALKHAVETNPQDVDARATLAGMLADGGHIDEAISHLDVAVNDDRDRADLLLERARILLRVDRTIEALESVDLAQLRDAGGTEVLGLRADILLQLGRLEEAAAWYERAFYEAGAATSGVSEPYARSLERVATDMYDNSAHFNEALNCLKPLLEAGVLSPEGMSLRAELLRLTGQYTQALEQADVAIKAGGDYVWTSGTKAQTLVDLSRSQEALAILDNVLKRDPNYMWARLVVISALEEVGRVSESLAALDQYFPEGESPEGWDFVSQITRARFLLDLGRYDEAISKLEPIGREADLADDDRAFQHGLLGWSYNRRGPLSKAVDELQASIGLYGVEMPNWVRLELADSLVRREKGLTDEARTLYQGVVTMAPPELVPRERADRAWALFRLGQVDEALADYRATFAAAVDPLAERRFGFVALLHAAGRPEADAELEQALAMIAAFPDRAQAREVLREAGYLLDLLAHDRAHILAAERLEHLRTRLAKQDTDGLAHDEFGAQG